uniref:Uncharacterized protein n=1 Tax=Rhipicephalus zambeziensis TaxID=60191 RepID=A0A224YGD5_9ACAR
MMSQFQLTSRCLIDHSVISARVNSELVGCVGAASSFSVSESSESSVTLTILQSVNSAQSSWSSSASAKPSKVTPAGIETPAARRSLKATSAKTVPESLLRYRLLRYEGDLCASRARTKTKEHSVPSLSTANVEDRDTRTLKIAPIACSSTQSTAELTKQYVNEHLMNTARFG